MKASEFFLGVVVAGGILSAVCMIAASTSLRGAVTKIPQDGYCYYESPVVAVGCTDGHCLVCTADHACRWMDWYTTCGQINERGSK